MLSRNYQRHAAVRDQSQLTTHGAASSFDNAYDRYSEMHDRYGTSGGAARHRRGRYKQKSHSLEYDLDRRDPYYDQEGVAYERSSFQPSPRRGETDLPLDYEPSPRLAARSLDRVHYDRQQPLPRRGADSYANPPGRRSGQPTGSSGRQQAWPSTQQGYRESGYSDQESETELLHYHRQQQLRKPVPQVPRRMSMHDTRQPSGGEFYEQEPNWREEPYGQQASGRQRGPQGYDRNE